MIYQVTTKKDVSDFVYFVQDLYKGDPYYVYPIFYVQKQEMKKYVIKEKTYKALLFKQGGQVQGRVLFTYDYSKKQNKKVCYFSP